MLLAVCTCEHLSPLPGNAAGHQRSCRMLQKMGRKSIELVLSIANVAASLNDFLKSIIIVALITCKDFPPVGIQIRSSKCWQVSPRPLWTDLQLLCHLPLMELTKTNCFLGIYTTLNMGYIYTSCVLVMTNLRIYFKISPTTKA